MKKIFIFIGVLSASIFVIWGICEYNGRNHYDFQGYITDVYENKKGETVIAALSGTEESTFTIKWYSKVSCTSEKPFINDRIMLSPTMFSEANIKKAKVTIGYFTEGKLVYADGMPFVLYEIENTKTMHLANVIPVNEDLLSGMETGDTVKFYHSAPVTLTDAPTLIAESAVIIKKGSIDALTAEEIAFVEEKGYKV